VSAPPSRSVFAAVVAHHLRLAGVPSSELACRRSDAALVCLDWNAAAAADQARVVIVLEPSDHTLATLAVRRGPASGGDRLQADGWSSRSLHPIVTFDSGVPHDVVATDCDGKACWMSVRHHGRAVLLCGSNIAADLIRFRQGDPSRITERSEAAMWGIPGERPLYLYEQQVPEAARHERPVDTQVMSLAGWTARELGRELAPILPQAAPGLIVVTGDDDQAFLDKYDEQMRRLNGMPITYFMHPLTKHTRVTLDAMARSQRTELALHPDALEEPRRYDALLTEQADWFERLTGGPARLVRNHGYLNDGYWGHLPSWRRHHLRGSANLPGIDGRVLTGSLWPARVATGDELTGHWSLLTLIGDGVRFALGLDGPAAGQCVTDAADRIVRSGIPGVLMLNLHPQNIGETIEMHDAVTRLTDVHGFAAMTFGECLDWFQSRDHALAAHRMAA
jgi:hypothetical protein